MGTGMNWMTGLMGMGLDSAIDTQGAAETGTDTVVATLNGAVDDALPSGAAEPSAANASDEGKRFTIQQIAELKGSEWKKKCPRRYPTNTDTRTYSDRYSGVWEKTIRPPFVDTFQ